MSTAHGECAQIIRALLAVGVHPHDVPEVIWHEAARHGLRVVNRIHPRFRWKLVGYEPGTPCTFLIASAALRRDPTRVRVIELDDDFYACYGDDPILFTTDGDRK